MMNMAEWKTVRMCECPECGELVQDMDAACLHKCKKIPEEKITALVEHVKKEFPEGCDGVICCPVCPLDRAAEGTIEKSICNLLAGV